MSDRNTDGRCCGHEFSQLLSSPKLFMTISVNPRNTEKMFSISVREHCGRKRGKCLIYFEDQNVKLINFACIVTTKGS